MSVSRRLFLSSVLGFAFLGQRAFAQEKSPLSEILSGISDRAMRDFVERHDKDGRWDGKYYYDRRNNKRYTKDEWRKELEWRFKEEKAGRDWHQERYGKPRRDRDDDRDRDPRARDEKKRKPRKPPKPDKAKKPPRPPKDKRPKPRKD